MGLCLSSLSPPAPHSSSSLNRPPQFSGSTSTDSNDVGFSAMTTSARKSQFSDVASGSFDDEGSLPVPFPSPNDLERPKLKVFTFKDLKSATNNFRSDTLLSGLKSATNNFRSDTLLGGDSFGRVYKGWLDAPARAGYKIEVAIKKLKPTRGNGFREWQFEVSLLGRLSHPNLIKLLGFCWDDEELLLVYEFMPNGDLGNRLFGSNPNIEPLSWNTRIKIAIGAARGLAFLHTSEKQGIIHRHIKPSNILLDGNYNAKISDFGLATLGHTGRESPVSTNLQGTYGYIAPEYFAKLRLSVKSDVYGFGVVLVEMLTGMPTFDETRAAGQKSLVNWVKPLLSDKQRLKTIMDAKIEGQYSQKAAFQASQLSLKCLEDDPNQRPSMKDVLGALEAIEAIQVKS